MCVCVHAHARALIDTQVHMTHVLVMQVLMRTLDLDGDGVVSLSEFMAFLTTPDAVSSK